MNQIMMWAICWCVVSLMIGYFFGYLEGKSQGWGDCSKFYRGEVLPAFIRQIKFLQKRK